MIKKIIIGIFLSLAALFFAAVFLPKNHHFAGNFSVKSGQGSAEIGQNLQQQEIISNELVFRIYVLISGNSKNLKAGVYDFSAPISLFDLVKKLARGEVLKEKITFPEGYNAGQIYEKLADITQIKLSDLQEKEGYLFPDTYEIVYGAAGRDIIKMMTDNFAAKTAALNFDKDDIIMASILEREVKTKEEKELVAGILWKRIRAGMPLQVDSALETYQKKGLPENPICNPGLESIKAALSPKASAYWYFLSTPDGQTIFSKTFNEHDTARAKYLR